MSKTYEWILGALAIVGALIAMWLFQIHVNLAAGSADLSSSCSALSSGNGCEVIALSPFSQIWIFPLPAVAMGFYFAMIMLSLWAIVFPESPEEPLFAALNMATLSVVVTVVMAGIAKYSLDSFCLGCAGLWIVSLAIWPVLVKRLKLSWGGALGANLESFRNKDRNLDVARVRKAHIFSIVIILVASGIGAAQKHQDMKKVNRGGVTRGILAYQKADKIFLPKAAFEGNSRKGNLSSDVVLDIVKFSDFQCPACKNAAMMFKPFYLRHSNRIRFTYRHYPLDGTCNPHSQYGAHSIACKAARGSICASNEGKFFSMHDKLFDGQTKLSPVTIKESAEELGLDMDKFIKCLDDPATKTTLEQDMNWGESISVQSTPTFVVNGRKMPGGGLTPSQWETLFEAVASGKLKK